MGTTNLPHTHTQTIIATNVVQSQELKRFLLLHLHTHTVRTHNTTRETHLRLQKPHNSSKAKDLRLTLKPIKERLKAKREREPTNGQLRSYHHS